MPHPRRIWRCQPNAEAYVITRTGAKRWTMLLLAMALGAATLTGCAAGSPGVAHVPAPTGEPRQRAAQAATDTATPTQPAEPTIAVRATRTPTPTEATEPTETPDPGPTPRPEPPEQDDSGVSQVYERGTSGRDEIALTFDAGSDRGYAEQILDTLAEYEVKVSFGITGQWAEENPDLVERMVAEGHMIFNHSWSHRSFTGFSTSGWDAGVLTADERTKELDDTAEVIGEATDGYDVRPYFRPPYGDLDDSVLADLAAAGYWVTVMWTCDSLGWNGATVEEIVFRCAEQAEAGDIILLHVGAASLDAEALPLLIETLEAAGFELVTVEELLQP
jgi:peptidoglycan/xylan/chitin deacetylase (PgdA/CDA1 family)